MVKRSLESLFQAMYHDKYDYSDFLTCTVVENCELSHYRDQEHLLPVLKPNQKLKAYLRFLNLFLFEQLPINERVLFSYRKGVGAYDAVVPHSASKYFFQTDISAFFSSIDRGMITSTIETGGEHCSIADLDQHTDRVLDLVCIDDKLPTGFPTSPTITNSVLKPFDDALEARCEALALTFSRYSDDIILSANSNDAIYTAPAIVEEILQASFAGKLMLNRDKSRHFKVGGKTKLLGMVILPNGHVSIDANVRTEIEVLLHFYLTDREKFLGKVGGDPDKGAKRVTGLLNYINTVDKAYLNKLRRKYGATVVDLFLHRTPE